MPYDKNGKYYRKPVYKVEKTKKDLPLRKNQSGFFFLGFITPLAFYLLLIIFTIFLRNILVFIPASIFYGFVLRRANRIHIKNYLEQGGKLTQKQLTIMAYLWSAFVAIFLYVLPLFWLYWLSRN